MASPAGLEPATPGLGNQCSIRLSYGDSTADFTTEFLNTQHHSLARSRIARERAERAEAPIAAQRIVRPYLRPLREILMPGTRLEIAELLVTHNVHLGEDFHPLVVGIAVIGGDVVADHMANRAPDDLDVVAREQIAGALHL